MYNAFMAGGHNLADADESFGVVVPVVVAVLFWMKRKELLALELNAWWPGLGLVVLGVALHLLGYVVQVPHLSILGLFTGIYGLTGMAWGPSWLRRSFFPFFLFVFCVPLGSMAEPLTFPLRLLVSKLVALISNYVLPFDVQQQGTILMDPTGRYRYEVAAACSGIRSLVATVAMSVVLGFYSFRTGWKRAAMLAAAFPLAVLGNVLRMLCIVVGAELWGQAAGNYVHDGGPGGLFSLLPYVPALAGLLMLERYLQRPSSTPPLSMPAGKTA
jgi:exosortase